MRDWGSPPRPRNWRRQDQLDRDERDDGLTSDEREGLRRLRRENVRLVQERDLLRAPSPRALTGAWLTERIRAIHEAHRGVCGGAADPCRPAPRARRPGLAQARAAADASGGYLGAGAPQARPHDAPRARCQGRRRPRRARVRDRCRERAVDRRRDLSEDLGGLAVPRVRPGRLLTADRGLEHGRRTSG